MCGVTPNGAAAVQTGTISNQSLPISLSYAAARPSSTSPDPGSNYGAGKLPSSVFSFFPQVLQVK